MHENTTILRSPALAELYEIDFWDAMIVNAANLAGAAVLYSEDRSHAQAYGSVRVTNPFLT